MEPVTASIVAALAAGAVAATKESATAVVKDAYQALKKLVQRHFATTPGAEHTLAEHEKEPEVWAKPLESALRKTGADKDEEVARRAMELIRALQDAGVSIKVVGSGAAAAHGGVAAGEGGNAAGRDNIIGGTPKGSG
jgi:hypothetical protein